MSRKNFGAKPLSYPQPVWIIGTYKVDVAKVAPICFDPFNHAYHVLGAEVGKAWDAGKALK